MIRILLCVGIVSALSGCSSLARYSERDVRSCVNQIFLDPDGYDPAAHFTIDPDEAPPFPKATIWVKDSLIDCLNGNRYPDFRWTY